MIWDAENTIYKKQKKKTRFIKIRKLDNWKKLWLPGKNYVKKMIHEKIRFTGRKKQTNTGRNMNTRKNTICEKKKKRNHHEKNRIYEKKHDYETWFTTKLRKKHDYEKNRIYDKTQGKTWLREKQDLRQNTGKNMITRKTEFTTKHREKKHDYENTQEITRFRENRKNMITIKHDFWEKDMIYS